MSEKTANQGFIRDVVVLVIGTALSNVILIVSLPIITRLYSPDAVGAWQLFVSLAMIFGTIITLRYELAIVLPDCNEDANNLFSLTAVLSVVASIALFAIVIASPDHWVALLGEVEATRKLLYYIPVLTLMFGLERACSFLLIRCKHFGFIATARIVRSLMMVGMQIGLAWKFGSDYRHLIAGSIIGQTSVTLLLCSAVLIRYRESLVESFSPARAKKLSFHYKNYPIYMAPYALFSLLGNRIILFVLAGFATRQIVGFYATAMQLAYVPANLVSGALNQVFYRKAARELKDKALDQFVLRILRWMALVLTPLLVMFILYGRDLILLLLGESWRGVGTFAVYLAIPGYSLFLTSWLDRIFDVMERQRLAVGLQVASDFVSIGVFVFTLAIWDDPEIAVASYCVTLAVYNALWLAIAFKIAGFPLTGLLKLSRLILVVGVATCGLNSLAQYTAHVAAQMGN